MRAGLEWNSPKVSQNYSLCKNHSHLMYQGLLCLPLLKIFLFKPPQYLKWKTPKWYSIKFQNIQIMNTCECLDIQSIILWTNKTQPYRSLSWHSGFIIILVCVKGRKILTSLVTQAQPFCLQPFQTYHLISVVDFYEKEVQFKLTLLRVYCINNC